jgi:imidazole glycerol-phosphate synthase subunit HisF
LLAKRIIPVLLCRGSALYKGQRYKSWRQVGHVMQAVRTHQLRGVDELILLDIDATCNGRGPDFNLVKDVSWDLFTPLTVGGGVRSVDDVRQLLKSGADKVCICTAAIERKSLIEDIANEFGSQALVVAIEVLNGKVTSYCGKPGADMDPVAWAKECEARGAGEILLSCVERDGMMHGYDLDLIVKVTSNVNIPVIALGGAGTYDHMHDAIKSGADAVAAGSMFQFTDATPKGAALNLKSKGVETRT